MTTHVAFPAVLSYRESFGLLIYCSPLQPGPFFFLQLLSDGVPGRVRRRFRFEAKRKRNFFRFDAKESPEN
jgi:hypothetical protein